MQRLFYLALIEFWLVVIVLLFDNSSLSSRLGGR